MATPERDPSHGDRRCDRRLLDHSGGDHSVTVALALTLGMWTHAVLNAMVAYRRQGYPKHIVRRKRPKHKPHNALWGELRLMLVVITTLAVWIVLWWVLDIPFDHSVTLPTSSRAA